MFNAADAGDLQVVAVSTSNLRVERFGRFDRSADDWVGYRELDVFFFREQDACNSEIGQARSIIKGPSIFERDGL